MTSVAVIAVEFAEILPWLAVVVVVLGVGVVVAPRLRRGAPGAQREIAPAKPVETSATVLDEPDVDLDTAGTESVEVDDVEVADVAGRTG